MLFELGIAENIAWVAEANDAEVREAAEAAELGADRQPPQADAVGPGGGRLSGGQRQRIAIARAMCATSIAAAG